MPQNKIVYKVDTSPPNISKFRKNSKQIKKEVETYQLKNRNSQKVSGKTLTRKFTI